ncbi:MAG: hypothetical protein AAF401_03945 [Pseudomonadota bacterium]
MSKRAVIRRAGLVLAVALTVGFLFAQVDAQAAVAAAYGEERQAMDPVTRGLAIVLKTF